MNPTGIVQAVLAFLGSIGTLLGLASRKRRVRAEIRENLALIDELQKVDFLRDHTPVVGWLAGKIVVDVAQIADVKLGTEKKPIPWGSVAFALVIGALFTLWSWVIDRDGFAWYSVFPILAAALMGIAVVGMLTSRDLEPPTPDSNGPQAAESDVLDTTLATTADQSVPNG